jgi:hypothetical protein
MHGGTWSFTQATLLARPIGRPDLRAGRSNEVDSQGKAVFWYFDGQLGDLPLPGFCIAWIDFKCLAQVIEPQAFVNAS